MDNELFRNGSGYADITAYTALKNYQKGEIKMEYKRGEIFEYEQTNGEVRKALVVSADFRAKEGYINVILLTEEPKGNVNVPIVCGGMMYADCGMCSFALNKRLSNYVRKATDAEMAQIDEGLAKCLGLEQKVVEVPVEKNVPVPQISPLHISSPSNAEELAAAKAEASVYKNLYEQLLAKVMG